MLVSSRFLLRLFLPFLLNSSLWAAPYFDFNPSANEAYRQTMSLRFAEARASIAQIQWTEPGNLASVFVENYLDCLQILIDDDQAAYRQRASKAEERLEKMARLGDRNPWGLYCQAEIRLQWAVLRLRFGDRLSGLSDIKQAYALLEENQRKHPGFIANKKSLGILHALVGNVPDEYRWALRALGGMRGTVAQGLGELHEVLAYARQQHFPFEEECLAAYAFLQIQLNNQSLQAWETLKNSKLNSKNNPLAAFVLANLALKTGRAEEAIQLLQQAPSGGAYHPFHYQNYLLGVAKLCRLDFDAHLPLQEFAQNFKGQNALKETYQKLAWHHLVHGNESGYHSYMNWVRTRGLAQSDADKSALREAVSGEIPQAILLRARLLFDGGYYMRARETLLGISPGEFGGNERYKLEYTYRMGRIAHKMGQTQEALRLYAQTVESGARQPWYFACNAALQLGILHEAQGDRKNARSAYQRCLAIHPKEYAGGIHARAKAGLSRNKD